jgi:hypothetical protein
VEGGGTRPEGVIRRATAGSGTTHWDSWQAALGKPSAVGRLPATTLGPLPPGQERLFYPLPTDHRFMDYLHSGRSFFQTTYWPLLRPVILPEPGLVGKRGKRFET